MKDLVERLKAKACEMLATREAGSEDHASLLEEAAREVEQLRSLNEAIEEDH